MKAHSYGRKEKLKRRKQIEAVFAGGRSLGAHPLRLVYLVQPNETGAEVQVGVSASRRHFKKAVDRNRVKRLLREAWRLNKQPLLDHARAKGLGISAFLIYTDKTLPQFEGVQAKMRLILNKLIEATREAPATNN